jgi:Fe-S oxidoreductase
MAPQRKVPAFASLTFKQWFAGRESRNPGGPDVMLWPDTFNDHFHPNTARAAVEVLEGAGYHVQVPDGWVCCGRPLYDYGMLGLAKRHLRHILDVLHEPIRSGVPIVVLEPSCAAVFRDELTNLLPRDENAFRLRHQTFLLSEFLDQKTPDLRIPSLHRKALVHGHCHHKALMGMDAEERVLRRIGLDYTLLDSGCCGMAGAFGFEPGDHYAVSIAAGERVLLPAVRSADRATLIVANGFSCREQIAQTTGRSALHLAEVIQLALRQDAAREDRTNAFSAVR